MDTDTLLKGPELAIVVIDMWKTHWSKYATARTDTLAPQIDEFLNAARSRGTLIVHAPSYDGTQDRPNDTANVKYGNNPQVTKLHKVDYQAGDWTQVISSDQVLRGTVWNGAKNGTKVEPTGPGTKPEWYKNFSGNISYKPQNWDSRV